MQLTSNRNVSFCFRELTNERRDIREKGEEKINKDVFDPALADLSTEESTEKALRAFGTLKTPKFRSKTPKKHRKCCPFATENLGALMALATMETPKRHRRKPICYKNHVFQAQ